LSDLEAKIDALVARDKQAANTSKKVD